MKIRHSKMYTTFLVLVITWSRHILCDGDNLPSPDNSTAVVGFVGKSIKLACSIYTAKTNTNDSIVTEWVDLVYNTERDPQRIFTTEGGLGLDKTHQNSENFHVDETDFSLTISNLKLEKDAGQYICRHTVGGHSYDRSYYLNVGDVPKCDGTMALRPGTGTRLSCQAQYSGVLQPVLTWVHDGTEIESIDEYDIMLAGRSVIVPTVTDQNDGDEYVCHMKFGLVIEQCKLRLDVAYLARDIILSPQMPVISVGDELRCSARGNPIPEIKLTTPLADLAAVRHGKGWKSMIIPDQWRGKEVTITCTASNTVDGATETLTQTAIYNVTERERKMFSKGAKSSNDTGIVAIVAGIVITLVITMLAVIAIVLIRRRNKDNKKPPKGAKPVPTKEEVTLDPNGQAV